MIKIKNKSIHKILTSIIDIDEILYTNPEKFNFTKLGIAEKIELLNYDFNTFKKYIDCKKLPLIERALMYKKIPGEIVFTEAELKTLSITLYSQLVRTDYKKFLRKDLWQELSRSHRIDLILDDPDFILQLLGKFPKIPGHTLSSLATYKPRFVDVNFKNFNEYSLRGAFWVGMIDYNKRYEDLFLQNINSCSTKTDVRLVFRTFPELIKKIDSTILTNSKLTTKEWLSIIKSIKDDNKEIFEHWKFSSEMSEIINQNLTVDVLKGKSSISRNLKKAKENLLQN